VENHVPHIRVGILIIGLIIFFFILPETIRLVFWSALQANRFISVMLFIFGVIMISLIWSAGQKLDTWVFFIFNMQSIPPRWLDRLMLGFTQLGSGAASMMLAGIFYFVNRIVAYELIFGTLTLWLLVELLKFAVRRSRPFLSLAEARIVGLKARGRSFPSGHTSQAFFAATLLAQYYQFSWWIVIGLYLLALLVGITRIYIGAHYPRDVLAGAMLGSVWGLLGGILEGYWLMGV
jgi:membrane-associated phospholipid phosphatase